MRIKQRREEGEGEGHTGGVKEKKDAIFLKEIYYVTMTLECNLKLFSHTLACDI